MIRVAPWDGRADLLPLWLAAWTEAMPELDFYARRDWFRVELARLVADGAVVLCADCDGSPVGFVTVHPVTGALAQLAVDPAFARRGLGAALLDAAKAASPGWLLLEVNQARAGAVRLYARAAFVTLGEGRNPASGLPTWRMRWDLNAPSERPTVTP